MMRLLLRRKPSILSSTRKTGNLELGISPELDLKGQIRRGARILTEET